MKIKVLINLGTKEFGADALEAGIHDVPELFAQKLIGRKLAIPVAEEPVKAKAVAMQGAAVAESHPVKVAEQPAEKPVEPTPESVLEPKPQGGNKPFNKLPHR